LGDLDDLDDFLGDLGVLGVLDDLGVLGDVGDIRLDAWDPEELELIQLASLPLEFLITLLSASGGPSSSAQFNKNSFFFGTFTLLHRLVLGFNTFPGGHFLTDFLGAGFLVFFGVLTLLQRLVLGFNTFPGGHSFGLGDDLVTDFLGLPLFFLGVDFLGASRRFINSLAIFFSAGVAEYFDIYIYINKFFL
jgi:hypothetical protein